MFQIPFLYYSCLRLHQIGIQMCSKDRKIFVAIDRVNARKNLFLYLFRPGQCAPIGAACICFAGPQEGELAMILAGRIVRYEPAVEAEPVVAEDFNGGEQRQEYPTYKSPDASFALRCRLFGCLQALHAWHFLGTFAEGRYAQIDIAQEPVDLL